MKTNCPKCDSTINVDNSTADKIRCGACGSTFGRAEKSVSLIPEGSEYAVTYILQKNRTSPGDVQEFGDYELIEEIARGGMGVVWKAKQRCLNRTVALKLIQSGEFANTEEIARFRAEAEAAAQLDHPGIVPVYEVGQFNGQHFFSMAMVDGGSLSGKVKAEGPLNPADAAELIKKVAEAVEYGHNKGIIHRDIKPQNILLDPSGSPRITDFGLAKYGESVRTVAGQVMGTPSYMPTEQAKGQHDQVGVTSDVYSLGATLYYLLTGRPPFQAASQTETLRQVIDKEPVKPRQLNTAIPRDLETICLKCLRKSPRSRYLSASEFALDLDHWLKGEPILARPISRVEKFLLWCRRRPAIAISLLGLILTLILASTLTFMVRSRDSENQSLKTKLAWGRHLEQLLYADRLVTLARSSDYREAVRQADLSVESGELTPMLLYDMACVFSLASETASGDIDIPYSQRGELGQEYAHKSVLALKNAHRLFFFSTAEKRKNLQDDPDLSAIRSVPEFQSFLEIIEQ